MKNNISNLAHLVFSGIIIVAIVIFLYLFNSYVQEQNSFIKDQSKIQKETYIKNLFSEYKNNIDSCKRDALAEKKDGQFIKENCIDVINSSILGKSLTDWDRKDLIISE